VWTGRGPRGVPGRAKSICIVNNVSLWWRCLAPERSTLGPVDHGFSAEARNRLRAPRAVRDSYRVLAGHSRTPRHFGHSPRRADLFIAVTTELGDVVLGPRGTSPTDIDTGENV
jgi:hypothetical protein